MNRFILSALGVCSVCSVCALVGCGKQEQAPPAKSGGAVAISPVPKAVQAPVAVPTNQAVPAAVAVPAPAPTGQVAVAGPAPVPPKEPAAAEAKPVVSGGGDFASTLKAVEELKQAAAFGDAVERVQKMAADFPDHADEVNGLLSDVKAAKRDVSELGPVLDLLTSPDSRSANVAADNLKQGGDAARIAMRKAVRERDDKTAGAAALLLAALKDARAFTPIAERLVKNPTAPARPQFVESLAALAGTNSADTLASLWGKVKDEPRFQQRDVVGLLGLVFETNYNGQVERFEQAMGQGVYAQLQSYVLASTAYTNDPAVTAWANEQWSRFGVFVPGIRGQYFASANFDTQVVERIDTAVQVGDHAFPYPDKRQDNFTARWSGKLLIATAGKYKLRIVSDDGNRLWIDGNKLCDQWGAPATTEAETNLTAGLHEIRIDYQQVGAGASIAAFILGPDGQEKVLDKAVLLTAPLPPAGQPAAPKP